MALALAVGAAAVGVFTAADAAAASACSLSACWVCSGLAAPGPGKRRRVASVVCIRRMPAEQPEEAGRLRKGEPKGAHLTSSSSTTRAGRSTREEAADSLLLAAGARLGAELAAFFVGLALPGLRPGGGYIGLGPQVDQPEIQERRLTLPIG